MAKNAKKVRYSVPLSETMLALVKEQSAHEKESLSAVLAQIVEEYYTNAAKTENEERINVLELECTKLKNDYEKQLQELQRKNADAERALELESEKAAQSASLQATQIKELEDEFEAVKTRLATLELEAAAKDDTIQALEQEKQAILKQTEDELAVRDENIQKLEEGIPELLRRIEQERASKETVTTGLQHELERAQDKIKQLEEQVMDLKGQVLKETDEKQNLYKQLELVTLRLPAPKEGFWARIFGRKKKQEL
ncbi:MAG: hypothetical protein ACXV3D_02780 [Halobacteriota archaeon]